MAWAPSFLVGLALAIGAAGARADVYFFVDADGITHYTNVPVDPRYRFLLGGSRERTESGDAYDALSLASAGRFDPLIEGAAKAVSVDPALLRAVIVVESGFNPQALSKVGAAGLMQLMPATARRYGVQDRFDPEQNIHAGARHLKSLLERYGDNVRLALAAYNAGAEAVDRCGGCVPKYRETQAYVPKVWRIYQRLLARADGV